MRVCVCVRACVRARARARARVCVCVCVCVVGAGVTSQQHAVCISGRRTFARAATLTQSCRSTCHFTKAKSRNDNNNRVQRRNSRFFFFFFFFFTISLQRREPPQTRTLEWPGTKKCTPAATLPDAL